MGLQLRLRQYCFLVYLYIIHNSNEYLVPYLHEQATHFAEECIPKVSGFGDEPSLIINWESQGF